MNQMFLQKQSLAERIAVELRQTIARQRWQAGRKLPPVRDLARQFEVSPKTAHSAIQLLAQRGIIGLRPRHGAFVRKISEKNDPSAAIGNQIGIIWPCQPTSQADFDNESCVSRIFHSAEIALREAGYYSTVLGDYDPPHFAPRIESMRPQLAGMLVFARPHIQPLLDQLDKWDLPWVILNSPGHAVAHNFVSTDYQHDCACLAQRIAQAGLRRLLLLTDTPALHVSSMEKLLGLCEGFTKGGASIHDIEVIDCAAIDEPVGHHVMQRRLATGKPPQVVFANGDFLALGAIRACREHGLRVPDDIGVIGGSGLRLAEVSRPSLSVMALPMEAIGRQAAQMIVEMATNGLSRVPGLRMPGQFIMRESFALPNDQLQSPSDVPAANMCSSESLAQSF
jgi:LacI family transcriptional regulator